MSRLGAVESSAILLIVFVLVLEEIVRRHFRSRRLHNPATSVDPNGGAVMETHPFMLQTSPKRRLINALVDSTIIRFLADLLYITLMDKRITEQQFPAANWLIGSITFLTVFLLYYMLFEALIQRTPAKILTRTKVVNADDGSRPGLTDIVKRTLIRLFPFEPVSGTFSGWWHDEWSDTWVIDA